MTKEMFVERFAEATGETKKRSAELVQGFIETTMGAVAAGEKVNFTGFGSFERVARAERNGYNPATGEKMTIPERHVVKFKVGKYFKEMCE